MEQSLSSIDQIIQNGENRQIGSSEKFLLNFALKCPSASWKFPIQNICSLLGVTIEKFNSWIDDHISFALSDDQKRLLIFPRRIMNLGPEFVSDSPGFLLLDIESNRILSYHPNQYHSWIRKGSESLEFAHVSFDLTCLVYMSPLKGIGIFDLRKKRWRFLFYNKDFKFLKLCNHVIEKTPLSKNLLLVLLEETLCYYDWKTNKVFFLKKINRESIKQLF